MSSYANTQDKDVKMKRPLVIALLVLALAFVCLGIGAVIFFAANNGFATNNPFDRRNIASELEESKTLNVDAGKPILLSVMNDSGDVTVRGGDTDTVQVDVLKTAYDSTQARADEEVKTIQYTIDQTGNDITIEYEIPDSMNFSNQLNTVDFVVTLPEDTSVEVRANLGSIDVSRIAGPVDLSTDFGTTTVENVRGALTVDSQSGSISASQVEAGDDDIVLATNFGQINLERARGASLHIDSQSGSLKLSDVRLTDGLVVATDFGEISLDKVTADSYELTSSSGSITLDGVKGTVKAYTDFGSINISNASSATLDLFTKSGSIDFAGSLGKGPHSLHSDFGAITLILPADSAFNVDLSTDFGQISSDIPVTVTGNIDEQHQAGTINGGGDELKVETKSGDVNIQASR
jgi:DUF4097 and DUF4098 domain-containing protein YvlB